MHQSKDTGNKNQSKMLHQSKETSDKDKTKISNQLREAINKDEDKDVSKTIQSKVSQHQRTGTPTKGPESRIQLQVRCFNCSTANRVDLVTNWGFEAEVRRERNVWFQLDGVRGVELSVRPQQHLRNIFVSDRITRNPQPTVTTYNLKCRDWSKDRWRKCTTATTTSSMTTTTSTMTTTMRGRPSKRNGNDSGRWSEKDSSLRQTDAESQKATE